MTYDLASIVDWIAMISIVYFFCVNSVYLFLIGGAIVALQRSTKLTALTESLKTGQSPFAPSISILAPAYNEQQTVVDSVRSFLLLSYPSFEVVVINDGSKDQTLARLREAFLLEPIALIYDQSLSKTRVRGAYRSKLHPNLTIVDKENGGKADALNIGIGFARHELFCAVDSDSLLENDALSRVAAPFLEDPARVIAAGGTVRIANGANVRFGRVESVDLPFNFLILMQIIEYTRAFLCGRIGWNVLNATLVISGAFGLFSKRSVKAIGGYTSGSIGEDMELIMRLHRSARQAKQDYKIVFVPDPVCWTEAPTDATSLGKQRDRWQRGLADTLFRNWRMHFNPRYGAVGLVALPYFLFVELLGPVIEIASLLVIISSIFLGGFDAELMWTFFVASILYGAVLSMISVVIEEIYFSKYSRPRQFISLFAICLIESFWYRHLSTYWRLKGLVRYLRGDHAWGHLQRSGFTKKDAA